MDKLRKIGGIGLLGAMLLVLAACESVSINKVLADPSHWEGKTVHVQGVVENSFGALGNGAYRISDGTGSIWVISRTGVPARGARVDVVGSVFQGAQLAGQALGTALREERHKAR